MANWLGVISEIILEFGLVLSCYGCKARGTWPEEVGVVCFVRGRVLGDVFFLGSGLGGAATGLMIGSCKESSWRRLLGSD